MFFGTTKYILAIAIVLSIIVSGCATKPPAGTPAPTATPAVTPAPITDVEVLGAPTTALSGKSFVVSWRVNSPVEKNITHTAVHYGPQPKSEPLTLQSYPSLTTPQGGKIPADFRAGITISSPGVIYFRAHAIIDGTNYWSPERTITITGAPSVTLSGTPTVTATTSR